ncbi:vWA domain-containing protein [Dactylosporangium sp. McL0621]|uniref:vWA domain-containing protein n=1 Tax=Dactylosporangium sp. McL0621 TaxID=3415678 RepID=UPI003CF3E822
MTEGRHHRRRDDDDLTADGIYVPPPREMPRPRSEPPAAAPSPWAPAAPGEPAAPPPAPRPAPPPERPQRQPEQAPSDARSSAWTERPSPWAPADGDEYSDDHPAEYEEEEPYAPVEDLPPPPPAHTAAKAPRREDWLPPLYPQEWPPAPTQHDWKPAPPPPPPAPPAPKPEHRSGTRWWVAVGVVIVALAVAAGVAVGLNLASRSGTGHPEGAAGAAGTTCGGREVLRATVTPELAPVVERAAADIGVNQPGGCQLVAVTATDTYAGGEAWIPATAGWAKLAKFDYAADPVSLARTPVVIASTRAYAESLGWPGKQPTWAGLGAALNNGQGPKLSIGSPLHDTAGLLAAMEIQSAMARTTTDPGIAQMRALSVRARLADAEAEPAKLLEKLAQQTDAAKALRDVGLFTLTEQDFWKYQQSRHPVAMAALYPADAIAEADFPLLLTPKAAGDGELTALAGRLAERMHAKDFAEQLTSRGLRPVGDAAPSGDGLTAQYQAPIGLPDNVAEWAATWAQYRRLAYHTLLLVDASASMNDEVHDRAGNVTTKAGLLRSAGVQAAQLFGDETSLGVWMFASPTAEAPPFTVVLPFGPIGERVGDVPRREAMRKVAEQYTALPKAGTPLFETVLRGVGDLKDRSASDAASLVVVLTDGRDQDSRFAMPTDQFLARLTGLRDPGRPVQVFAIGYGGDADMTVLRQMAQLTGGQAVASNDPGDLASAMAKIFLAAHAPR